MKLFGKEITFPMRRTPPPEKVEAAAEKVIEKRRMQISEALRQQLNDMPAAPGIPNHVAHPIRPVVNVMPYTPPKGVAPAAHVLAMDNTLSNVYSNPLTMFSGMGFPGYPYLMELSQISEYRDMSERIAAEMTRKWIKFRSTSSTEKHTERIKLIEEEFKRIGVRDAFRRCAELDKQMGRGQIFINLGDTEGPELKVPLFVNRWKIKKGSLIGLKVVEPIMTYPKQCNTTKPLSPDYYKPASWYVSNQEVHSTRLLTFVSMPLPDMLKSAYNFGGISLSQLAEPYVTYWLNTRDSVGRLLRNFSTTTLKTSLQDVLAGGQGSELIKRIQMFAKLRDNFGVFILNNDTASPEEMNQINTPLSGLDKLQAQSQEHMAGVAKIPLVILLGISPTGLNATAEGELQVFYTHVADQQDILFRHNLEQLLKIVQLSLFEEVFPEITFDFVPLAQMTEPQQATVRKSDTDAAVALINASVVSAEEVRKKLADDPESGFNDLEIANAQDLVAPMASPTTPVEGQANIAQTPVAFSQTNAPSPFAKNAKSISMDSLMEQAMALDSGFKGNQHTGSVGAKSESSYLTAAKMSGIARRATSVAFKSKNRSAHMRAAKAHVRALDAHQSALLTSKSELTSVHDAYSNAHKAAITLHQEACNG